MHHSKTDPKFVRAYQRGMLRSAMVSLFYAVISQRKKAENFTMLKLAEALGKNKGEVSRWFSGSPNWTLNTIAAIADALDVELHVKAVDRRSGMIFTPAGIQSVSIPGEQVSRMNGMTESETANGDSVAKPKIVRGASEAPHTSAAA